MSGANLALAFVGGLFCALALGLALVSGEPFAAECGRAMTTYCGAEFLLRAATRADFE